LQQLLVPGARVTPKAAEPKAPSTTPRRTTSGANSTNANTANSATTNSAGANPDSGAGQTESGEQGLGEAIDEDDGQAGADPFEAAEGSTFEDGNNAPPDFLRNGPLGPESLPRPRNADSSGGLQTPAAAAAGVPLVQQEFQIQVQPPSSSGVGLEALPRVSHRPLLGKFHPVIEERRPVQATLRGPQQQQLGNIGP